MVRVEFLVLDLKTVAWKLFQIYATTTPFPPQLISSSDRVCASLPGQSSTIISVLPVHLKCCPYFRMVPVSLSIETQFARGF
jgi:hypothetical protein